MHLYAVKTAQHLNKWEVLSKGRGEVHNSNKKIRYQSMHTWMTNYLSLKWQINGKSRTCWKCIYSHFKGGGGDWGNVFLPETLILHKSISIFLLLNTFFKIKVIDSNTLPIKGKFTMSLQTLPLPGILTNPCSPSTSCSRKPLWARYLESLTMNHIAVPSPLTMSGHE